MISLYNTNFRSRWVNPLIPLNKMLKRTNYVSWLMFFRIMATFGTTEVMKTKENPILNFKLSNFL